MARTSPVARSTRRKDMAHVGGYMAEVDTAGMDPEMKATMSPARAQRAGGLMESIKSGIKKLLKPKNPKPSASSRSYSIAEADSILRVKKEK